MPPKDEQYQLGDDGLIVEKVGAWAKTKHRLLTDYIQASVARVPTTISAAAQPTSTCFAVPAVAHPRYHKLHRRQCGRSIQARSGVARSVFIDRNLRHGRGAIGRLRIRD